MNENGKRFKNLISFSDELMITQPSFTSSVGGYSSYLAYPVEPRDVVKEIEVQFHFTAEVTGDLRFCDLQYFNYIF